MGIVETVTHYYVWYQVDGDMRSALSTVARLQSELAARTGARGRLLARADDPRTWMEIYENIQDENAFDAALAAAVAAADAQAIAAGGTRHTERFIALDVAAR